MCECASRSGLGILTRGSVVDGGRAAGRDGRDAERGQPHCHVQQGLDDVALEDVVLLPEVQHSHDLTLRDTHT